MEEKGFENADIVFITDGECVLPPEFISRLQEEQVRRRFTITGILLDQGNEGMDFSLSKTLGVTAMRLIATLKI